MNQFSILLLYKDLVVLLSEPTKLKQQQYKLWAATPNKLLFQVDSSLPASSKLQKSRAN